ncbi:YfdX family protein [Hydrogenimonas sp.]
MRQHAILSAVTAMMLMGSATLLSAEPGNFGVNGSNAWNQPIEKRVKHTDSFGDTYYTYSYANPKHTVTKEVKKHAKAFKQAPKEVIDALNKTLAAMEAIQKNEISTAKKELKSAIALFDKALKANPKLRLVPIDQTIEVKTFDGTVNDIKADIDLAVKLLKSHRTQLARDLLLPLEDEIDITTHYLPMDLYPKAAKKALEVLNRGKKKEALLELALGLSVITADELVIPVPLLNAQAHVEAASKVFKKDKKEALALLDAAKEELHKALLLGYTTRHAKAYESIYKQITQIQKEIKGANHSTKLFEKIKKSFESLLHKTRKEKKELKDSDSVWKGTAKAHAAAAKEETKDKLRFEEKEKADDF